MTTDTHEHDGKRNKSLASACYFSSADDFLPSVRPTVFTRLNLSTDMCHLVIDFCSPCLL